MNGGLLVNVHDDLLWKRFDGCGVDDGVNHPHWHPSVRGLVAGCGRLPSLSEIRIGMQEEESGSRDRIIEIHRRTNWSVNMSCMRELGADAAV